MGLLYALVTCSFRGQSTSAPHPSEAQLHALQPARTALCMSSDVLRMQRESCVLQFFFEHGLDSINTAMTGLWNKHCTEHLS